MLVDTLNGIVNTDHVVSIEPTASGRESVIRFADGQTRVVKNADVLERSCGTVVPAQPGFDVVLAYLPLADEEGGVVYTVEPVIAFRIGLGIGLPDPMPITVSGEPSAGKEILWTVRQPNGVCFGPEGAHDTLKAFEAQCEREAASLRKVG